MKPLHFPLLWLLIPSLFGLPILTISGQGEVAGEDLLSEDDLKISLWDYSTVLRGGLGYKDNVLLSHTDPQSSAFWMSGLELMVFRLPTQGWLFTLFADVTDVRYFNCPAVDDEQLALAATQISKDFGQGWKSAVGLYYIYQNEVFDYSTAYVNENSVGQILGHALKPRGSLRKTIGRYWVEGEMSGTRQWLEAPLDNYWQFGPRAALGRTWENGTEVTLSYQYTRLDYDHRNQVDQNGNVITNTPLAQFAHRVDLSYTQVWDEKKHWQTMATAGFESWQDNGSGFYDYDVYRLTGKVRYRDEKWEITALARLNIYDYATQTVSDVDTSIRSKTSVSVAARIERKLTKHLLAYANYSYDRSLSNLDFDDYTANVIMAGLGLSF